MADIAVSSCRIINRAADRLLRCQRQLSDLSVNIALDLFLDLSLHLMPHSVDHLDPIIIVGIMACRDHNAAVEILCPYYIGYAGCGSYMEQIRVRPGCRQSGRQRVLKHIAASSGVFSDHDPGLVLLSEVPAQIAAYLECMLHGQDNIGLSAETVSSKIFSHFFYLLIIYLPLKYVAGSLCGAEPSLTLLIILFSRGRYNYFSIFSCIPFFAQISSRQHRLQKGFVRAVQISRP